MGKYSKNLETNNTTGELFLLSPVNKKPIEVSFTAPDLSSPDFVTGTPHSKTGHQIAERLACVYLSVA